jgi:hypothetical protein
MIVCEYQDLLRLETGNSKAECSMGMEKEQVEAVAIQCKSQPRPKNIIGRNPAPMSGVIFLIDYFQLFFTIVHAPYV